MNFSNTGMGIVIITVLLAALSNDSLAQERIVDPQRAVVFWNGVNGCKPSAKLEYDYVWEENADNLSARRQMKVDPKRC
jgi:hypothetical protein